MVGQSMAKGKYVYYRCRRSYAGKFEGKCDSRYVGVESLERTVLEQIAAVLADPQRILDEAKHINDMEIDVSRLKAIDQEVSKVEEQQRRLTDLYVSGSMPQNILESKSAELSQQRFHLEAEQRAIGISTPKPVDLDQLSSTLPEAAARIRKWVLEASGDDMDLILNALQIKVTASRDQVQIEGSVPVSACEAEKLVTIVQTSA